MQLPSNQSSERPGETPSRRDFLNLSGVLLAGSLFHKVHAQGATGVHFSVLEFDRVRIVAAADSALSTPPLTLSSLPAPGRSAMSGQVLTSTAHDLFGAPGDDSSPAPNLAQTDLLQRACARVAACTAAWRLTREPRYLGCARTQLRAWCTDAGTRMEPTFEGVGSLGAAKDDARVNGIEQTVCLAELARAAAFVCAAEDTSTEDAGALREWFAALLTWLHDSKKGAIAREAKDLQAVCWAMQAAEFARLTRNEAVLRECTHRFRDQLLRLMSFDGNFAFALHTKRPYAASMFALECLGSACESLSTPFDNLWKSSLPDGRSMRSAVAWASPFLASRAKWPYVADAHLFGEQPVRNNALLFAGRAYDRQIDVDLWKTLRPDTGNVELRREHPITQPGLWAMRPPA